MDWWHYTDVADSVSSRREVTVSVGNEVNRGEPFLYRLLGLAYLYVAIVSVWDHPALPGSNWDDFDPGWSAVWGTPAISLVLAALGLVGTVRPWALATVIRARPRITTLAALAALTLLPLLLPNRDTVGPSVVLVATAATLLSTRAALVYGALATVIQCGLTVWTSDMWDFLLPARMTPPPGVPAMNWFDRLDQVWSSHNLDVVPVALMAAALVGSLGGRVAMLSRSLGETLDRESARAAALKQVLAEIRSRTARLLRALPALELHAQATLAPDDGELISHGAEKARSRDRDLRWATVEIQRDRPTPLSDDLREVIIHFSERVFLSRLAITLTVDDTAPVRLEPRAQNALRVVLARALENIHQHAPRATAVAITVGRRDNGSITLAVDDDGGPATRLTEGEGTRHSRKRIEADLGGQLTVSPTPAGVRVLAVVPDQWQSASYEAHRQLVSDQLHRLISRGLNVMRITAAAIALASLGRALLYADGLTAGPPQSWVSLIIGGYIGLEVLAWTLRHHPRHSVVLRLAVVLLWCALVYPGDRYFVHAYAGITLLELLWWYGIRVWLGATIALLAAILLPPYLYLYEIPFNAQPGDAQAIRAFPIPTTYELVREWAEVALISLVGLAARLVQGRVSARERAVKQTVDSAQFIGELAHEVSAAHDLLKPLEGAISATMPHDPAARHILDLTEAVRAASLDYDNSPADGDALLTAIARTVAHRVHPAKVTVIDRRHDTAVLLATSKDGAQRLGMRAAMLSAFGAAADKLAQDIPPGLLGTPRVRKVEIQLTQIDADRVDVALIPTPLRKISSNACTEPLGEQVGACGGELLNGFDDNVIRFQLPATVVG